MFALSGFTASDAFAQTSLFSGVTGNTDITSTNVFSNYKINSQLVSINHDAFLDDDISLTVFGDTFVVSKQYLEQKEFGFLWSGENDEGDRVIFAVNQTNVYGIIDTLSKSLQVGKNSSPSLHLKPVVL